MFDLFLIGIPVKMLEVDDKTRSKSVFLKKKASDLVTYTYCHYHDCCSHLFQILNNFPSFFVANNSKFGERNSSKWICFQLFKPCCSVKSFFQANDF